MGEMVKIYSVQSNNFIHIADPTFIHDTGLSWKAKGIYTYLMSRSGNWEVRATDLINKSSDGATSLRSGMKELVIAGYVHKAVLRDKVTKAIQDWKYYVFATRCPIEEATVIIKEDGHQIITHSYQDPDYFLETDNVAPNEVLKTTNNDITNNETDLSKDKSFNQSVARSSSVLGLVHHLPVRRKRLSGDIWTIQQPALSMSEQFAEKYKTNPTPPKLFEKNRRGPKQVKYNRPDLFMKEYIALRTEKVIRHGENTRTMNRIIDAFRSLRDGTYFDNNSDYPKYKGRIFTKEEIDKMTISEYIDNCIMLDEVLKIRANLTLPLIPR